MFCEYFIEVSPALRSLFLVMWEHSVVCDAEGLLTLELSGEKIDSLICVSRLQHLKDIVFVDERGDSIKRGSFNLSVSRFMVFIKELVVLMILIKCEQMTPILFQKSIRNPLFIDFFHNINSIKDLQWYHNFLKKLFHIHIYDFDTIFKT
jgi:hypothetical protein